MNHLKPENKLNRNGDRRGVHPNSLANLKPNGNLHGRPKRELSITNIQREMLNEVCPFDPKGRTWLIALAEAGMRLALVKPDAMRELRDRLEGKVMQPIGGADGKPFELIVRWDGNGDASGTSSTATPISG